MTDTAKPITYVVLSYFPLLTGAPGDVLDLENEDGLKALDEVLSRLPDGDAIACLWVGTDGGPRPVFVFEDADAVHDHLIVWSEDDPAGWFNLTLLQKDGKYLIGLAPDVKRSIDRFRIARQLKTGLPVPEDAKFSILFRCLYFVSGSSNMFELVKDGLPEEIEVGFMDASLLNVDDPGSMDQDRIRWVGPFPKAPEGCMDGYFGTIIDEAEEPAGHSVVFDKDGTSVSP